MNFRNYQELAKRTAQYPPLYMPTYVIDEYEPIPTKYVYPALGLCGEAGEVAEKIKKIIRNKNGKITLEDVQDIKKELGDVLWYIAAICNELSIEMEDVAKENIEKLSDRAKRGVIKSQGDNR